jgi:glycogen debranching enzyme
MASEARPKGLTDGDGAEAVADAGVEAGATAATTESADAIRWLEPRFAGIAKATDLGSVQVLKHGNIFLLTDPFGDIHSDSRGLGLYRNDTRLLSCSILRIDGVRPVLLQGSAGANFRGVIQLTNPTPSRDPDAKMRPNKALAGSKIGITRDRLINGEGLRETLRIVNHAEHGEMLELALDLANDAADLFEVRGYPRPARGTLLPTAVGGSSLAFRYDGLDQVRRLTHLSFSAPVELGSPPADANPNASVRAGWRWELEPGEARELVWTVWATEVPTPASQGARHRAADPATLFPTPPRVEADEGQGAYLAWTRGSAAVATDNELFNLTLERSLADLRLLVNDGPDPGERYVAAGVPWFTTLFGRDSILTALQVLPIRPQIAMETLRTLASRQATELDDLRDAEPGKILHELRSGEMARAGELPHRPYYGSIDSTPLWLILLGATFDWTGDRGFVDDLWPNALAALDWIDSWGDRDGDGFVEYLRRADRGLYNQGWKDSGDAIRDRAGAIAEPPIALAEVQGYVHDAKLRMARLALARGEGEMAARLQIEASALRDRFEAAFWVEDQQYYALALDRDKRRVDGIASNAGHCLWTGIVDESRARHVADRLLSPELFSGWGIRTLAAGQPGYNPISYHNGSVWPHDTSLAAAGLKRYGFHEEANRVVGRVFEAAQHFPSFRLPELFCGFDRDDAPIPVPYPVACSPQAWSAGASFMFVQTMLGLRAHADRGELELIRPNLPDWLTKVTVSNLRVGEASVDLLFHRWRGTTSAEVLRKVGDVAVTIRL